MSSRVTCGRLGRLGCLARWGCLLLGLSTAASPAGAVTLVEAGRPKGPDALVHVARAQIEGSSFLKIAGLAAQRSEPV